MDEKTREKIIKWIFDNHEHHEFGYCEEFDSPYVNSMKLEEFIKSL